MVYSTAMDKLTRRDRLRDYKEKKTTTGVYAVRCAPTGQVWAAGSRPVSYTHLTLPTIYSV